MIINVSHYNAHVQPCTLGCYEDKKIIKDNFCKVGVTRTSKYNYLTQLGSYNKTFNVIRNTESLITHLESNGLQTLVLLNYHQANDNMARFQ